MIETSGIRATFQPLPCAALLAGVGSSLVVSPGPDGLFGALLAALMVAVAAEDFRRYIIPNELTGLAVALGLLRAGMVGPDADWTAVLQATLRAGAITLPLLALMTGYRRWRGRDGLGLGDVKLAAVAGVWLGLATIVAAIELAALSALAAYFLNSRLRKRPLKATAFLPFGLFLAPAIWIGWLVEAALG
ncbi:MAG: leader peptidase (prepilin peptidase) / N-methyltransferase [Bradyrhizobium sp.]|nr:leader peptidase (prepilin peptidase) / N-methyltransferase [Bradyrhizobium sp.]